MTLSEYPPSSISRMNHTFHTYDSCMEKVTKKRMMYECNIPHRIWYCSSHFREFQTP